MPRYHFDLHNDLEVLDEEGIELRSLEVAKAHALDEARTMIKASVTESGKIDLRHRIEVRDDSGAIIYTVHFEDAVAIVREGQPV
jgi:hypothetical protein